MFLEIHQYSFYNIILSNSLVDRCPQYKIRGMAQTLLFHSGASSLLSVVPWLAEGLWAVLFAAFGGLCQPPHKNVHL